MRPCGCSERILPGPQRPLLQEGSPQAVSSSVAPGRHDRAALLAVAAANEAAPRRVRCRCGEAGQLALKGYC